VLTSRHQTRLALGRDHQQRLMTARAREQFQQTAVGSQTHNLLRFLLIFV
jgi:hypothetical protein